jgi:hypothetical protein
MMEVVKLALENGNWKKPAMPRVKKSKLAIPVKKHKYTNIRQAAAKTK